MKVGVVNTRGSMTSFTSTSLNPLSYRFNNNVPNLITMQATPYTTITDVTSDLGIYAQDKWTLKRLTVTGGVRFDHFATSFPEQHVGPAPLAPNRNITFPVQDNLSWNDITPKSQVVYDVVGNGKTAFKVSFNKYVAGYGSGNSSGTLLSGSPNPVATLVTTTTRSWGDNNGNFVPDCSLTNLAAQGPTQAGALNTIDTCGVAANPNFGSAVPGDRSIRTSGPDGESATTTGSSASAPSARSCRGVSLDVAYFRKWYSNFQVTDDLARAPGDFDPFSVTAALRSPSARGWRLPDRRLPECQRRQILGSGSKLSDARQELWHANRALERRRRLGQRAIPPFSGPGGISSGRTVTDNCEVLAKLPEMARSARRIAVSRRRSCPT